MKGMITQAEAKAAKARADAATKGPWEWEAADYSLMSLGTVDFVTHARADVPALAGALEEAMALLRSISQEDATDWLAPGDDEKLVLLLDHYYAKEAT